MGNARAFSVHRWWLPLICFMGLVGVVSPVQAASFSLDGPSVELRRVQFCVQCNRALIVTTVPTGAAIQCPHCNRVQTRIPARYLLIKLYQVCPRCASRMNVGRFSAGSEIRCATCDLRQRVLPEALRKKGGRAGLGYLPGAPRVAAVAALPDPELLPRSQRMAALPAPELSQPMVARATPSGVGNVSNRLPPRAEVVGLPAENKSGAVNDMAASLPGLPEPPRYKKRPPEILVAHKSSPASTLGLIAPPPELVPDLPAASTAQRLPVARAQVRIVEAENPLDAGYAISLKDFLSAPDMPAEIKRKIKTPTATSAPTEKSPTAADIVPRPAAAPHANLADNASAAALVNGVPIPHKAVEALLERVMQKRQRQRQQQGLGKLQAMRVNRERAAIREVILDQLIDEWLVLGAAKKAGVSIATLRMRHAKPSEPITKAQSYIYYSRNREKFMRPPQTRLRALIVFRDRTHRPDQRSAAVILREAMNAVKAGMAFQNAVERYADEPFRAQGGAMVTADDGFVSRALLAAPVQTALASAKPGTILPPLSLTGSVALVQVEAMRAPSPREFEKVSAEIRAQLEKKARQAAFMEWIKSLRTSANIQIQ